MEMVGIRTQGRNSAESKRPRSSRPELQVARPHGDLDAYVVHFL